MGNTETNETVMYCSKQSLSLLLLLFLMWFSLDHISVYLHVSNHCALLKALKPAFQCLFGHVSMS